MNLLKTKGANFFKLAPHFLNLTKTRTLFLYSSLRKYDKQIFRNYKFPLRLEDLL